MVSILTSLRIYTVMALLVLLTACLTSGDDAAKDDASGDTSSTTSNGKSNDGSSNDTDNADLAAIADVPACKGTTPRSDMKDFVDVTGVHAIALYQSDQKDFPLPKQRTLYVVRICDDASLTLYSPEGKELRKAEYQGKPGEVWYSIGPVRTFQVFEDKGGIFAFSHDVSRDVSTLSFQPDLSSHVAGSYGVYFSSDKGVQGTDAPALFSDLAGEFPMLMRTPGDSVKATVKITADGHLSWAPKGEKMNELVWNISTGRATETPEGVELSLCAAEDTLAHFRTSVVFKKAAKDNGSKGIVEIKPVGPNKLVGSTSGTSYGSLTVSGALAEVLGGTFSPGSMTTSTTPAILGGGDVTSTTWTMTDVGRADAKLLLTYMVKSEDRSIINIGFSFEIGYWEGETWKKGSYVGSFDSTKIDTDKREMTFSNFDFTGLLNQNLPTGVLSGSLSFVAGSYL